jgi:carbamoyltransferase
MKHILGISAGFHDAAVTLIDQNGNIVFAGHSERYSKQKNDANISAGLMTELAGYPIDNIAYYERPWVKQLRNLRAGQGIDWTSIRLKQVLTQQLGPAFDWWTGTTHCYNHHLSHAAAGFQTSPYDRATVVVIDAIGEFDTVTIWGAEYDRSGRATYKKLWGQGYPHSIGLFYSAITQRVGLHPLDEEYITMGMSAYGTKVSMHANALKNLLVDSVNEVQFKQNMHIGVDDTFMSGTTNEDLAAGAQAVAEELIYSVMRRAREFGWSSNLVYMGGVALNCLANRNLGNYFDNIWIMPCPGDAGSSLGSAALAYGKQIHWKNAFLGHNIPGAYPVNNIINELVVNKIVGVASGREEFGPRALGNRSLLADPRGPEIKNRVNEIKRRQQFRPFAPVILEECVGDYFEMPQNYTTSPYMQVVARCRHPDQFPAIIHVDDTSRVQTVSKDCESGIRQLLERWYVETGCPMLLNTSLNIRGEPMVNDRSDADRFEQLYGVKVCS